MTDNPLRAALFRKDAVAEDTSAVNDALVRSNAATVSLLSTQSINSSLFADRQPYNSGSGTFSPRSVACSHLRHSTVR